jgi:hypothetical protein
MSTFVYRIIEEPIAYTGRELRSGWVAQKTGLAGDAAAAFLGACEVPTENLVDMDDAAAGEFIRAGQMAHVIVEHPSCPLGETVLRQRILVCILCGILRERGRTARRDGDDIYIDDKKLTVSIAAPSHSGSLIHLGINIDPVGAPVAAIGLNEMGIDAKWLLAALLQRYKDELASCAHAMAKVRGVP